MQKVSVVIPVRNSEKTLPRCLRSVTDQTYKDYEVIVVDNNSTDRSKEIIRKFDVKYFFEPEIVRGAARHAGEMESAGSIILMTDSDCIVPKGWIASMARHLKKYRAVQGSEQPALDGFWSRCRDLEHRKKFPGQKVVGSIDTKNFGIRKSVLRSIGFTDRTLPSGNDTDLSVRLARNNIKVGYVDVKVSHFHPESAIALMKKQYCRARWTVFISKKYCSYLKKTDFFDQTSQTAGSFFRFFPGIIGTFVKKGPGQAYYDFVAGISWRAGVVSGYVRDKRI